MREHEAIAHIDRIAQEVKEVVELYNMTGTFGPTWKKMRGYINWINDKKR
jgi:hypothetical protein